MILVEDHGVLVGLVTVKDVLRFTVVEGHHEPRGSWSPEEFEGFIEEAWTWVTYLTTTVASWTRRLIRR